jgi:hypothetical protein
MTDAILLRSVDESRIASHRAGGGAPLDGSRTARCSHVLASWVAVQPLGGVLAEALDGGESLDGRPRGPFLPPGVHLPLAVARLAGDLRAAWNAFRRMVPLADDHRCMVQIRSVVALFEWARLRGESVVACPDPPLEDGVRDAPAAARARG